MRFSMQTKTNDQIAVFTKSKSQEEFNQLEEEKKSDDALSAKTSTDNFDKKNKKTLISKKSFENAKEEISSVDEKLQHNEISKNEPSVDADDEYIELITDEKKENISDIVEESESIDDITNRSVGSINEKLKKDEQTFSNAASLPPVADVSTGVSKKSSISSSENAADIFLEAKDFFDIGKYKEALPLFRKVLTLDDYSLWEYAQWFEALSLLNTDKNKEARKLLEKISTSNSRYKGDALDKLKEME